jgi:hypothetical protein
MFPGSLRRLPGLFVLAGIVTSSLLGSALAAGPTGPGSTPSRAFQLELGVPLTIPGPDNDEDRFLRLPGVARLGDRFQLAVENDGLEGLGVTNAAVFFSCAPMDDFDDFSRCSQGDHPTVNRDTKARISVPYDVSTSGQGYIIVRAFNQYGGSLTLTLEQVIQRVRVGMPAKATVPRRFELTANVRYGDNTPVPDGSAVALRWRLSGRGKTYRALVSAATSGGRATFRGAFPLATRGRKVHYQACTSVGGKLACSVPIRSRVRR